MTKAAVAAQKTPNKVANQGTRAAKVPASSNDFVLLCPSAADSVLAQAALYFLPANYKLRVLVETFQDIMPLSDDQTIVGRISFGSPSELDEGGRTPLPHNAVIYSDSTAPHISTAPKIMISRQVQLPLLQGQDGTYRVASNSPEALASAMLYIARQVYGLK